mmetsp:Transcript_26890/g.28933  ORF Transcript_26890/g.28933 Transcript_26890/m.28933 type:complete len:258 (-) Transcript_26890:77-850(-)
MLLLNSIAKKLSIWNWRNKIVSSLITVCRTVTVMLRTAAIAMAATATVTTITAITLPLLILAMPPTPPRVTIAIPLTAVLVPPATVEVGTVRVVAITVARVAKEEDITVAKVAKEAMVEEETRVAPFTTVGVVVPRSTPPMRTVVTMAVVPEVLLVTETRTDMAVLDTERRTAVAVAVEEVIMVMERLTAVAVEVFTTLFESFFLHVCIWSTNKSKAKITILFLSSNEEETMFPVYVFIHSSPTRYGTSNSYKKVTH